jgi:hypothetical protein
VDNWRAYKARKSFAVEPEPLPTLTFDVLVDGKAVGTILAVSTETAERFLKKRIRAFAYPSNSMLLPKL